MSGALGVIQLQKAGEMAIGHTKAAMLYGELLEDVKGITPLQIERPDESSWHLYVVRLDLDSLTISRDEFLEKLRDMKIGTSVHYRPLHMHTHFINMGFREEDYPIATDQFSRMFTLPLFPGMEPEQVEYVVDGLKQLLATHRKA